MVKAFFSLVVHHAESTDAMDFASDVERFGINGKAMVEEYQALKEKNSEEETESPSEGEGAQSEREGSGNEEQEQEDPSSDNEGK